MHSIRVDELLKLNNVNIIDIRNSSRYLLGHIPNSINISENELINNSNKYLKNNIKYYIYCQSGIRSSYVVNILNNQGFDCVNIVGGYNNYVFRY